MRGPNRPIPPCCSAPEGFARSELGARRPTGAAKTRPVEARTIAVKRLSLLYKLADLGVLGPTLEQRSALTSRQSVSVWNDTENHRVEGDVPSR